MFLSPLAALVALPLLASADGDCTIHGESCTAQGDEMSLIQSRRLLSRRSAARQAKQPSPGGPFASRTCEYVGDGSTARCYPDILFAGTSKAGSTSVSEALKSHPLVYQQRRQGERVTLGSDKQTGDEVHVFDWHLRPISGMLAIHWETTPVINASQVPNSLQLHYTPNYMYYPDAPLNIYNVYPNARSIKYLFMIREPVARAVSAWKFHRQVTMDLRSFEEVVSQGISQRERLEKCYGHALSRMNRTGAQVEDLPMDQQRQVIDECFWGRLGTHDISIPPELPITLMHAHVDKGVYVDQLRRWFSVVGRENCFVFSLEEWAANGAAVFTDIMNFIGLEAIGPRGFPDMAALNATVQRRFNDGEDIVHILEPPDPSQDLIDRLHEFYEPYNKELFALVGRTLY